RRLFRCRQPGTATAWRLRLSVGIRHREDRARSARAPDSRRNERDHAPHRSAKPRRTMSGVIVQRNLQGSSEGNLEDGVQHGDLVVREQGALRRITLNRPKAFNAVMDGLVMGGGVGLSTHAAHRIVTERSAVALPEVGIGFFPDIGASYWVARTRGFAGTYLALTGERANANDSISCGLADVHIASARLAELPQALAECRSDDDVRARLRTLATAPAPAKIEAARRWIDACFGADEVEEILARLAAAKDEAAQAALAAMRKMSP